MDSELYTLARDVRAKAHAPYSRFHVGAAIRAEDGRIYVGANVENASFPEGWCAETSAIGAMISAATEPAGRRIAAVMVVADRVDGGIVCTPCGGCRQRLREFAGDDTPVWVADLQSVRARFTLGQLLPASFGPEHLEHR